MGRGFHDRLLWREQGTHPRQSSVAALYGDPYWVHNLDIVNELGGHEGCVNTVSWSKSGRLLASGADDTKLLIHRYQPDGATTPFSLATEISTGHTANIFSVKFMPHSNDTTLISCAGDSEVRVFDVEYSARNPRPSPAAAALGYRGGQVWDGVRYLSEGDTNARVYRSHADRVKRIVTESSPFLFLTCSEDGEVRQWDLRQPSSAYPEPPDGGMLFSSRRPRHGRGGTVPPPLISYRRFRLDLNTISCSASQPHYIALGGAHLHCFLHDRRMIGRDMALERGSESPVSINDDFRGDEMGKATRCVRRFAPNGTEKMDVTQNGHITACKISDANPNEMIVSWSSDNIYSFDLIRSPDVSEHRSSKGTMQNSTSRKSKRSSVERKRKRPGASPSVSDNIPKHRRSRSTSSEDHDDVTLRVRYGNGQSEDIALNRPNPGTSRGAGSPPTLHPSLQRSLRIAKSVVKIRRLLFSLEHDDPSASIEAISPEQCTESLRKVALLAVNTIERMDRIITSWRYPMDPDSEEVAVQTGLRRNRDRARRFVQAAGCISQLWASDSGDWESSSSKLDEIGSPGTEGPIQDNNEIFRYDFLKAILAWLIGGTDGLLSAFRERTRATRQSFRFPIPKDAGISAINRYLIRHLLLLASERSVPDLERNRFEHDATRALFETERHAVTAFEHVIEIATEAGRLASGGIESGTSAQKELAEKARRHNPETVRRFWGFKAARGILMNAAEGIDFALVDRAFGGLGRGGHRMDAGREQTEIDPDDEEEAVAVSATLVQRGANGGAVTGRGDSDEAQREDQIMREENSGSNEDEADHDNDDDSDDDTNDNDNDSNDDHDINVYDEGDSDVDPADLDDDLDDDEEDDEDDEDEAGPLSYGPRRLLYSTNVERMLLRESVDSDVPVGSHTRSYKGHRNVDTVKDVNFYGLNDEYVVSGSDSGHVFIWDRQSTKLLNILVGDGHIVNVVQGHPYEPMLAVSGIDYTIKIFSADHRAQRDARLGVNLAATQRQSERSFTTVGPWRFMQPPLRRGGDDDEDATDPLLGGETQRQRRSGGHGGDGDGDDGEDSDDAHLATGDLQPTRRGLASRRRIHDSYAIMSQNALNRRADPDDAEEGFITSSMLQRIITHMQMRHAGGGGEGEGGDDDEGHNLTDDDNCMMM